MRAVIQRVLDANVKVDGEKISEIDQGLLVLVAVKGTDTEDDINYIKKKIEKIRIFEDEDGKMNKSVSDIGGKILLISQFTLYGDMRNGNRPSFIESARPEMAVEFYEKLRDDLRADGFDVQTGQFQTHTHVNLTNDGPCTILIDSEKTF